MRRHPDGSEAFDQVPEFLATMSLFGFSTLRHWQPPENHP